MRRVIKAILDFDEDPQGSRETVRNLLGNCRSLGGQWDITLEPKRRLRTDQQNKWYWSCIVGPFYEYLADQDYEITRPEQAHDVLREQFLRIVLAVDRQTEEPIAYRTKSTTELSTVEFSEYCERCRAWLSDFFDINTQDPPT